jgi:hypothetical protein
MRPFKHFPRTVQRKLPPNHDSVRRRFIPFALAVFLNCPFVSAQWVQIGLADRGIGEIAVGSAGVFAVTCDSGRVYRTTNGGVTWVRIVDSLGTHIAVAPNGTTFMAVGDSLYRSTDAGTSWSNLHMLEQLGELYLHGILCVAVGPYGRVFSGTTNHMLQADAGKGAQTAMAISNDNGSTWTRWFNQGVAFSFKGHSVMTTGGWSGMTTGGVYHSLSFDDGLTWSEVMDNMHEHFWPPFGWCANGNIIGMLSWFMSSEGLGLAVSVDTCASLTKVSDIFPSALLALPQGGVLVGTDTSGIYLFSDDGDSLGTRNQGLTDLHIHALASDSSGYAYVGTNNGIWRRPFSELVVSVNATASQVPQELSLSQNYPNPFNPTTIIKYELPKSSEVRLSVFDVLGREVTVLVDERTDAGVHEVKFDGSNLSSGVYFYRLQAGDFTQTKRLLLLK